MQQEQEYHFHQGQPVKHRNTFMIPQPPNDQANRAHNYDQATTWTIETYDRRLSMFLQNIGASEKPCLHDGRLFVVDAKQLIEFIAESSGLVVEFRKHKKRQYSEEQKAAMRQRIAKARQKQGVLSVTSGHFVEQDAQESYKAEVSAVGGAL